MKILVQRSKESSVKVGDDIVGKIPFGMVVFVCFERTDHEALIPTAVQKILNLRIFEDPQNGKMSLSLSQIGGQILLVSQFTLSWDGSKGNRPSFDNSMEPQKAEVFYGKFCQKIRSTSSIPLETGSFAASMQVSITNDGPVTFFFSF